MYIEKLTLTNFRCFEKAEMELNYPKRRATKARPVPQHLKNVNLFLGGNGSGKSSIFKALVLGALAPLMDSSGFTPDFLIRRLPDDKSTPNLVVQAMAEVKAHLVLSEVDTTSTEKHAIGTTRIERFGDTEKLDPLLANQHVKSPVWERISLNDSPAFFMAGYGANRRTERPEGYSEKNRSPRYQRVASIFEDHVGLVPFTHGYWNLQSLGCLEEAKDVLNGLLPDGVELTTENSQVPQFRRQGVSLPFSALSDGFRTFVGWVWDLLLQLARVRGDHTLAELQGVVIVDEIDLFLHPEWQRHVIEKIAQAFPKLQFFFSTHSPLVAGTLEPENIFVMGADGVEQYQESIHGLTANQVLTSSYFGLSSTRAPGTEMSEISKLALSGKEADRLEFARRMAEAIPAE